MDERPISRRGDRIYPPERVPADLARARRREAPPPRVEELVKSGRMSSAFRRELRERSIDPRMARLVLCFYERMRWRPRELAWMLGVSRPTVSRWLDRAEQARLIDKSYVDVGDRRGTDARLTESGRALRLQVERLLEQCTPKEPRFGVAYGLRSCSKWDR